MSAFETAEDDTVERAAIEVLARYGDQREVNRLLEPLARSDRPNRDIAVREWRRADRAREGRPRRRPATARRTVGR